MYPNFPPCYAAIDLPVPGILMLNILLLIPLMTSVVNGIDSSLVNGEIMTSSMNSINLLVIQAYNSCLIGKATSTTLEERR